MIERRSRELASLDRPTVSIYSVRPDTRRPRAHMLSDFVYFAGISVAALKDSRPSFDVDAPLSVRRKMSNLRQVLTLNVRFKGSLCNNDDRLTLFTQCPALLVEPFRDLANGRRGREALNLPHARDHHSCAIR